MGLLRSASSVINRIIDFLLTPSVAAIILLISALLVFRAGFNLTHTEQDDLLTMFKEMYSNLSSEFVGIAVTVIIVDRLNRRRDDRERLQELIKQMVSTDNRRAVDAVETLRLKGWLVNGSLRRAKLFNANLAGANLLAADLTGIFLSISNLTGANMQIVKLDGAVLHSTDLTGAILTLANLRGTDLRNTYLTRAILNRADLTGANLRGANLRGAHLSGANLRGANLREANLRGARLSGANFINADLIGAILPDSTIWAPGRDMREFTHPEEWKKEQAAKFGSDS